MNEDMKSYLKEHGFPDGRAIKSKKHADFYDRLLNLTSFLPEKVKVGVRMYCVMNDVTSSPSCIISGCENAVGVINKIAEGQSYPGFARTCSKACSGKDSEKFAKIKHTISKTPDFYKNNRKKAEATMIERYGVDAWSKTLKGKESISEAWKNKTRDEKKDIVRRRRNTNRLRYGDEEPMRTDVIRNKQQETLIKNYGVSNPSYSDEIKEKIAGTTYERYGSSSYLGSSEFREVRTDINMKLFGKPYYTQTEMFKKQRSSAMHRRFSREHSNQVHISEETLNLLKSSKACEELYIKNGRFVKLFADEVGIDRTTASRILKSHGIEVLPRHSTSIGELEVLDFVKSIYHGKVEVNVPVLDGKHLDIYLPEIKIGIEFNGCFFHSEKRKPKMYHHDKTNSAMANGIRLLHIWEDLWKDKRVIIENTIRTLVTETPAIYARKTKAKKLSPREARGFHESFHIQGSVSATIHLALCFNEEVVAVLSMKEVKKGSGVFDLVRFSSSIRVVGGFSKLLAEFKRTFEWNEIYTFANRDISYGELYIKTGFEELHTTNPIMWYYNPNRNKRHHRKGFMKSRLKGKISIFDESLTERENMRVNGFIRIFDSGLIKYRMVNS